MLDIGTYRAGFDSGTCAQAFVRALCTEADSGDTPRLREDTDWAGAAQQLIDACAHAGGPQQRLQQLEQLSSALGPALYPAFIGALGVVGERGSHAAMQVLADTLLDALRCGRLPCGRRPAWGGASASDGALHGMRTLGPVEYLCAWQADARATPALDTPRFEHTLRALLHLASQAGETRSAYCDHLQAVADDPIDGALSRSGRAGLAALADAWRRCGADMDAPVAAFLRSTASEAPRGCLMSERLGLPWPGLR